MSTTNILDLNNRIDNLEKFAHNVEPIQQQIDELKAWTDSGTKDATGNPIILTDGAAFKAEGLVVTLEPKQNLHGYDHPWAGGAGKNKLNSTLPATSQGGLDYTPQGDGIYKINGTASSNGGVDFAINVTLKAGTYKILGLPSGVGSTNTYIGLMLNGSYVYTTNNESFTLSEDTTFDSLKFRPGIGTQLNNVIVKPMISSDTSVTYDTYEPYSNECPITGLTECVVEVKDEDETTQDTATITFGQTVYGAIVNPKTGKVTVTHGIVDLGSLTYTYTSETYPRFATNIAGIKSIATSSVVPNLLSDIYPAVSAASQFTSGALGIAQQGGEGQTSVYIRDTNYTDATTFKTAMNGHTVCYELATPTELTLSPAELELLKGYNYITTNGNNIELTYQPDNLKADILLTVSQLYGSKISIFDGILAGGDTGQVLTKTGDDDYDATWETLPATRTTTRKSEK